MKDCIQRYSHPYSSRLCKSAKTRFNEIDKQNARPKTFRTRPDIKMERCPFLKCDNCDSAEIFWMTVDEIHSIQVRQCYVCNSVGDVVTSAGNPVQFQVRRV